MSPRRTQWLVAVLLSTTAACGGHPIGATKEGTAGTGDGDTTGGPGGGDGGAAGTTGAAGTSGGAGTTGAAGVRVVGDPGFVGERLLSRVEYDNTVRDLLGVKGRAVATFSYEPSYGTFDNSDANDGHRDGLFREYFEEGPRLAAAVLADPAARARVIACPTPASSAADCVRASIPTLGPRAWRRPLTDTEAERVIDHANAAQNRGATRDAAIGEALAMLLSADPFFLRTERGLAPFSREPHEITAWELATRLSYTLWRTMPDDRLFARAADGTLLHDDVLAVEVDRLLDDARADALIEGFASRWLLGGQPIAELTREARSYPEWSPELARAMEAELHLFVREYLRGERSFATFPSDDFNFVNAPLARLYGFPDSGLGPDLARVEVTSDRRRGFLGLGAFLAASSLSYRTSIPIRGTVVLRNLLCVDVAPPPPDVPKLDAGSAVDPAPPPTPREYFLSLEQTAECGSCHKAIDAYGLALEEFDAVGRLRTSYGNGWTVDPRTTLSDGTPVAGGADVAVAIARDPRFLACVARQALSYARGRWIIDTDAPVLSQLGAAWTGQGTRLRALFREIALDPTFRLQRDAP
jgi:hypothetical protein